MKTLDSNVFKTFLALNEMDGEDIIFGECRFCNASLKFRCMDAVLLGINKMTVQGQFDDENHLPEKGPFRMISTYVCQECFLVQTKETHANIGDKRSYLSPFSSNWLVDVKEYIDTIFEKFELVGSRLIIALVDHRGNLISDPNIENCFFGNKGLHPLIEFYGKADEITCCAELACVDDINDFISGIKSFLKPDGIVTLDFLHLLPSIEAKHVEVPSTRHFPYFSFTTVDKMMKKYGLEIVDVAECSPQGSLRIKVKHCGNTTRRISNSVPILRGRERDMGMSSLNHYIGLKNEMSSSHPISPRLVLESEPLFLNDI